MKEFIELREAWFDRVIKLDENDTKDRCYDPKEANKEMKAQFDQQTLRIILGKSCYLVAPTCSADLDKGERSNLT